MKNVTQSVKYTCDGCGAGPITSASLPANWKEVRAHVCAANQMPLKKVLELCPTCGASGNANGKTALATLLS